MPPKISLRKSKELIHHTEEEVYSIFFELAVFACLLVSTTLLTISTHDPYMYQFDSLIDRIFVQRETMGDYFTSRFGDLVTVADWYDFAEQIVLKYWHNRDLAYNDNGKVIKERVFLTENFHIGAARVRQIRVQPNSCPIHEVFNRYFNSCFARYSEEVEEKSPHFQSYNYYPYSAFPVRVVSGLVAKYYGPGYVVFFKETFDENDLLINHLKSSHWIDRATRVVLIEFVLYNSNLNMLINVKFITEFLPTGSLLSTYRVSFLPIYSIWSLKHIQIFILATIVYAIIVYCTADEFWYFMKIGFYNYLRSKWNWLDCFIIIFAYTALTISIVLHFRVEERLHTISKNPRGDIFIDDLCYWFDTFRMMLTCCTILVWLKIFRFISFNVTMLHFSQAIRRSLNDIFGFAVMFFIVFIGYSLLGLLLFSNINPGFANFPNALVTMMRMIMGDYQYQNIEKADQLLGPAFFISYIIFIYFILLNMFLAIISDTYVSVKEGLQPPDNILRAKFLQIGAKIIGFFKKCLCRKKSKAAAENPYETDEDDNDANKQYYGSVRSSIEDLSERPTSTRNSLNDVELLKLSHRINTLELDLEALIPKMDRIIQKLDAKIDEQKIARNLGRV